MELQQALDVTKKEMEDKTEKSEKARMEWEREREAMKEEISELRDNMRQNYETLKNMEGKHEVQTGPATTFTFSVSPQNILIFMDNYL